MNHHLGIRPYTCVKCESKFSQSSNMKTHMKKCTGVKQKPRSSGPRATYQQVQSVGPDLPVPSPDVTSANAAIMHAIMNQAGPNRQAAGAAAIALPDDTELINYVNPMISIQSNLPAFSPTCQLNGAPRLCTHKSSTSLSTPGPREDHQPE